MKQKKEKTIGEIIAEARQKSGLSLRAVAGRIPINFSYLSEIEKGRRMPSEKVILALSEQAELRLDFDYLMAHSTRLGKSAENYLKKRPALGRIIRKIAHNNLSNEKLELLDDHIDKLNDSK